MAGNAVGVLDDEPVGKQKVFVYEMPHKYNKMLLDKDSRCLHHMFAAEIFMHRFLLSRAARTLDPVAGTTFSPASFLARLASTRQSVRYTTVARTSATHAVCAER
jgi:hypothetical protein